MKNGVACDGAVVGCNKNAHLIRGQGVAFDANRIGLALNVGLPSPSLLQKLAEFAFFAR